MASESILADLKSVVADIKDLDRERVMRPDMKKISLERIRPNYFDDLKTKCDYYLKYAYGVSSDYVGEVTADMRSIFSALASLNNANDQDYAKRVEDAMQRVDYSREQISKHDAHFMTVQILDNGILEDESIAKREAMVKSVVGNIDEIIEEAKQAMENVEKKRAILAKEAAEGSFGRTIKHFKDAQNYVDKRCESWQEASFASIGFLVVAVLGFLFFWQPGQDDHWTHVIYNTAIRLTLLGILGAVATFCLRAYRSHVHMSRQNYHRQCIAKCMDSFVHAAVSPEQKDKILSILVESLVTFGASGLVQDGDDHMPSSKLVIDQFTKMVSPKDS